MKFLKFFKLNKYRVLEENKLFYPEERVFLLFWSERLNNITCITYTTYMTTCLKSAEKKLQLLNEKN